MQEPSRIFVLNKLHVSPRRIRTANHWVSLTPSLSFYLLTMQSQDIDGKIGFANPEVMAFQFKLSKRRPCWLRNIHTRGDEIEIHREAGV